MTGTVSGQWSDAIGWCIREGLVFERCHDHVSPAPCIRRISNSSGFGIINRITGCIVGWCMHRNKTCCTVLLFLTMGGVAMAMVSRSFYALEVVFYQE